MVEKKEKATTTKAKAAKEKEVDKVVKSTNQEESTEIKRNTPFGVETWDAENKKTVMTPYG